VARALIQLLCATELAAVVVERCYCLATPDVLDLSSANGVHHKLYCAIMTVA
jgi:hypothetical protein